MLEMCIWVAGIGQLVLVVASLAIPRCLGWREETARLRPLTRQVFWTYAGYIWATNLSFGLISVSSPASLTDGSVLATSVSGFIAVYWAARLMIQFTYFDRSDAPGGKLFQVAEALLVGLFIGLTAVYGYAVWVNFTGHAIHWPPNTGSIV